MTSSSFSKFNSGTVRVNKRLSGGIAVGAHYEYSHSIDDAGAVGGARLSESDAINSTTPFLF